MELAARTLASNSLTLAAIALEIVAVVGVIGSLMIHRVPSADYVKGPWIGWLARLFGIIPIRSGDGPRALLQSLNTAREALLAGELV